MQTWNALGPDGILVNQLAAPDHRMVGNVGWLAIDGNSLSYGGISQSGAVANLDAAYTKRYGSPPRAAPRASLPGATSTPGRPWPRR